MTDKKTIVFDFGGVLFRTSATEFYKDRFTAQGRSVEELDYFLNHIFTKADRSSGNAGNLKDVIERKAAQHPAWADEIKAFGANREFVKQVRGTIEGMQEVLEDLSAEGYTIVGLTNWASDTYDTLPKAFPEILGHFNDVVVSGKVHLRKPNADIFELAQKQYGAPDPANVYYFDDKPANIDAAQKSVGWNGFVFESAETVRQALALKRRHS